MENKDDKFKKVMSVICTILIILLALCLVIEVGINIYCIIKYGSLPIDEIPAWAWHYLR